MTQALYFIFKTLTQLYLLLFILRFWLPLFRADFHNPIAQGVLRLTSPLVIPLRRFVPPIGRLDTATVLVALVIECALVFILLAIRGRHRRVGAGRRDGHFRARDPEPQYVLFRCADQDHPELGGASQLQSDHSAACQHRGTVAPTLSPYRTAVGRDRYLPDLYHRTATGDGDCAADLQTVARVAPDFSWAVLWAIVNTSVAGGSSKWESSKQS